jgi:hypothetical protein
MMRAYDRVFYFSVLCGIIFVLAEAGAVLPQTNYRGTVTDVDQGKGTIRIHALFYLVSTGDPSWTPCDYHFTTASPNADAMGVVTEGDYVETSTLAVPGECGPKWVSIARGRKEDEAAPSCLYLYGDPSYIHSDLSDGFAVVCTKEPDCDSCGCAVCSVKSATVSVAGAGGPYIFTLSPGENESRTTELGAIDVTFHEGQAAAFPTCTDVPCAGPQPISNFSLLIERAPSVLFVRGDPNCDGRVNIADAVFLLSYLFAEGAPPSCSDAADANDDEALDLSDAVAVLSHLFAGTGDPPLPFPGCGADPAGEALGCDLFPPCIQ